MAIDIDFAPQTEAWLKSEAKHRGIRPADLVRRIVEEQIVIAPTQSGRRTPQERIAAMDEVAAKHANAPILPDSAFDRENIYEDKL